MQAWNKTLDAVDSSPVVCVAPPHPTYPHPPTLSKVIMSWYGL